MAMFDFIRGLMPNRGRRGDKRSLAALFGRFRAVLALNNAVLAAMASMNSKLGGGYVFDLQYLRSAGAEITDQVRKLIDALDALAPGKYPGLRKAFRSISQEIEDELAGRVPIPGSRLVIPFEELEPGDQEAAGAKTSRLAEAGTLPHVTIPAGVAVTAAAYQAFMEHNRLSGAIAQTERQWLDGAVTVNEASKQIRALILAAQVPSRLRKALVKTAERLCQDSGHKECGLAVRSSAWGEDGRRSFAGQYATLLNVPPQDVCRAYVQVLAGTYAASAMEYRRDMGFSRQETAMAVSVQAMVRAQASGVVYTLLPNDPGANAMVIAANWGLGLSVVSGSAAADSFTVSRIPPHDQTAISIVRKERAVRMVPGGGVHEQDVAEDQQTKACLSADMVRLLARTALELERRFKSPQDVEFAVDQAGRLVVLQTRPLRVDTGHEHVVQDLCESLSRYPVLLSGRGDTAQQGIGAGPAFIAREGRSLEEFPAGAILVARHSSPSYAAVLKRAAGVVTDIGSLVGHMATIAREYRVPALLNAGNATKVLTEGQVVTLDAEQRTVYLGQVQELCLHDLTSESMDETFEYRLLKRMLKRIEPLNLIDPSDRNFTPAGCRTLHDITRFVHEKAVEALIAINLRAARSFDPSRSSGRLELPVPLDLVLMDIGGGLADMPQTGGRSGAKLSVRPEDVVSAPMRAFIDGVTAPGVWQITPAPVDFTSFMSSLTRTFSTETAGAHTLAQNLAVISDCYAHLSLRLGYHFTMIDCLVGDNKDDNYAYFRFTGGVTGVTRRSRRARFLAEVLSAADFSTTLQDDLVAARIKKLPARAMLERVRILGLLVAYTRQLDVSMSDDTQIHRHAEAFERILRSEAAANNRRVAP